jgi:hypothetical protein
LTENKSGSLGPEVTLADTVTTWIRVATEARDDLFDSVDTIASDAEPGLYTFLGYWDDLSLALIVDPRDAAPRLRALAPVLERAIAHEDRESAGEPLSSANMRAVDLANGFACAGLPMSETTWSTIRTWLPRMQVTRDDEFTAPFWNRGLAALCLDDRILYRWYAGAHGDEPLPPPAGETYGPNVRGTLAALAAAVEQRASANAVMPALDDLLEHFQSLFQAKRIDVQTLLWAARVVHHHLRAEPVSGVLVWFHDLAWQRAGLAP